jgi:hypothetical protein
MLAFAGKHFVCDFLLQRPYYYRNKGTYGHPGGLLHALEHGVMTVAVLSIFVPAAPVLALGMLDAGFHYHIDWAKMNINAHFGWRADTSDFFWAMLGLDQLLHTLTYALIVWVVIWA